MDKSTCYNGACASGEEDTIDVIVVLVGGMILYLVCCVLKRERRVIGNFDQGFEGYEPHFNSCEHTKGSKATP